MKCIPRTTRQWMLTVTAATRTVISSAEETFSELGD